MKVSALMDEIEMTLEEASLPAIDRARLLRHMGMDLAELVADGQWEWAMMSLDPLLTLTAGTRGYILPEDFPENFVRGAGDKGEKFCCKLDNGTNEVLLDYISLTKFYAKDLVAETNGTPAEYSIEAVPGGRRKLVLSPPPDSSYTYYIDGLYVPTSYTLDYEDDIPAIPQPMYLKYSVLRRYMPNAEQGFQRTYTAICMAHSRNRRAQFVPRS